MAYAVFVEGLKDLEDFKDIRKDITLAAQRAVNKTAKTGRTQSAREILRQVAFGPGYLQPSQKRLYVSQFARRGQLEARITARQRPTSLARFVTNKPRRGQGARVQVKPGRSSTLRRAFLIRLPAGQSLTETRFNQGLAIRLRPGETLRNKREAKRLARGLYLLYGPSVDQVFLSKDDTGVASDIAPDLGEDLENEFLRLLDL